MVEAFSEDLVRRVTGLSGWQLRYWDSLGIASPSVAPGDEGARLYSFLDLMRLKVAGEMRRLRLRPTDMKKLIDELEQRGFNDPLVSVGFFESREGRRAVYLDPAVDGPLSARPKETDQIVETFDLPLRDLRTNLQDRITDILRRRTGHVAKVRNIQGSRPVIEGTRVPVAKIAALARAGWDSERILTAFPHLTEKDVTAALRYRPKRSAAVSA